MSRHPRVLILPSPVSSGSIGTVAKALGVARLLQKRGCQVRFAVGGELARLIKRYGFSVSPYPVPCAEKSLRPICNIIDVLEWTGLADPDFVAAAVEAELVAIHEFRPDVIFAETRPSAAISAAAAGIPLVTIASWPTHPQFPANRDCQTQSLQVFNHLLKRYHLPEIENVAELLFLRSDIKLSPSLPELEPELQLVPDVEFIGYMLDTTYEELHIPSWYRSWQKENVVFVYLSVGAISPDIYIQTLQATFADLACNVVCACGFHYDLKHLPETVKNVHFVRFIPAKAVIEEAQLVIFHGGQDTMLMTLLHGLPSITFPGQHFERQYNSIQLAHLGASKSLPIHAFRPARLRQVIEEVTSGHYKTKSRELAGRLSNYGGTERGVTKILSVV